MKFAFRGDHGLASASVPTLALTIRPSPQPGSLLQHNDFEPHAQQGSINVLSGAPYGYRYVKKTDTSAAYYEVVESEADVVRLIFDAYTRQGLSIAAIAGLLNQREVPTRTRESRWERTTLWRMLHNPAYEGHAFYGKTELRPRQGITRRLRQRGLCSRDSSFRERLRPEWIEIPVPALVSEATFALAQEQFEKNQYGLLI